jgi:hypothetical protein
VLVDSKFFHLFALKTTSMPPTSRKRRGSISPVNSSQRAGQIVSSTAVHGSRRKSSEMKVNTTRVEDAEEKVDDVEGGVRSPFLPPRPPLLANKTPFLTSQAHPPLHSTARPFFGLHTPANEGSTSIIGILGSSTLPSSGLFMGGAGNHFSVSKSRSGLGIATQGEQGELASRKTNNLLSSSSLMKPTTYIHPVTSSNPLPIPPSSPPNLQQSLLSLSTSPLTGGERVHSQFGLGSPLVIRPRSKQPTRNRFCVFALFVAAVLSCICVSLEYRLKRRGQVGFVESFLTSIPPFSLQIIKLLDIDNAPINAVDVTEPVLVQVLPNDNSISKTSFIDEHEKGNASLVLAVDKINADDVDIHLIRETELINFSTFKEVAEARKSAVEFPFARDATSNLDENDLDASRNVDENMSKQEIPLIKTPRTEMTLDIATTATLLEAGAVDDNFSFLIELKRVKETLAAEKEAREAMMIAFEAKIKASFEECRAVRGMNLLNQPEIDSDSIQNSRSLSDSISKALADVNEVKDQLSFQLKEATDFVNSLTKQFNSMNETHLYQLNAMRELSDAAKASSEAAETAAVNAAMFAANASVSAVDASIAANNALTSAANSSMSASAAITALATISSSTLTTDEDFQIRDQQSLFERENSTTILSEIQASFSSLNATVVKDLNAALQRCEELTSIINGKFSQDESSVDSDFRLDGLVSLLKETRSNVDIHTKALEELRQAAVKSSEVIDRFELDSAQDRSNADDFRTLLAALSKKIDDNKNADEKSVAGLTELRTLHTALSQMIDKNKEEDEAYSTILNEVQMTISALSIKVKDGEKKDERLSSILDEMKISMESLTKKLEENEKEGEKSDSVLFDLQSTISALSKKMDAIDSEAADSFLEEMRTSIAILEKKFVDGEKSDSINNFALADIKSSISSLKSEVNNLTTAVETLHFISEPLKDSSLIESTLLLSEVGIAQLRNESIWIERRLREVVKSQKVHEMAVSESFLEVGDTLEFLTEMLFNHSLNISQLFVLVQTRDVLNESTADALRNYCDTIPNTNQQRSDLLLSESRLFRALRSSSMPPSSPISASPFPHDLVRHTWADGTSFDGIAAMAVSNSLSKEYATLADVAALIDLSLAMSAADHAVPLPDYALAQGGAEVLAHLTSPSWLPLEALTDASEEAIEELKLSSSPYNALQPSVSEGAGHCWPMAGSNGRLTVRLKTPIHITAITIDHLPSSVSPVRNIKGKYNVTSVEIASQLRSTSAPKRFVLYGLSGESKEDEEGKTLLGSFTFDASKASPPTQTFHLGKSIFSEGNDEENSEEDVKIVETSTPIVMLHVLDNHGHPDYTCIYRFRVHGYVVPGQ